MGNGKRRKPRRRRLGRVSYYLHHGSWYLYYRDGRRPVRRRVEGDEAIAEQVAAQVNAQLTSAAPTMFSFTPLTVSALCYQYLEDHEHVLRSSLATVRRYRAALNHLEEFSSQLGGEPLAHELQADRFVRHLRTIEVAPNGHPHAARRKLRDKGIRYILEVCRSLYGFAARKRHLPPYAENPFTGLGSKRLPIEDAKQVFVFDSRTELAFLQAADRWAFPIHFTLAKTGIRPGELIHLLIEDLDLEGGWMHIVNKPELGWQIKTRRARSIPLVDELVDVLRDVVGGRAAGPVFLREQFDPDREPLAGVSRDGLAHSLSRRIQEIVREKGQPLSRQAQAGIARGIWRDAGALKADRIRISFIRIARSAGLPGATCPKSWRHTFATLLQDANVDPLVRQITLGHAPTAPGLGGDLGMTAVYTHTRSETQRREILRAIQLWPESLEAARRFVLRTSPYCKVPGK